MSLCICAQPRGSWTCFCSAKNRRLR